MEKSQLSKYFCPGLSVELVFLSFGSAGGQNEKLKQVDLEKIHFCTVAKACLSPKMAVWSSFFVFVFVQNWKIWKWLFFLKKMPFTLDFAVWLLEKDKFLKSQGLLDLLGPPTKLWQRKIISADNPGRNICGICCKTANFHDNWPTLKVFLSLSKCRNAKNPKVPESPGLWSVITDQLSDSDLWPKILSLKS